ncbi:MAG TPA: hypothetical protein VFU15_00865 [Bacteroidia bacterium]|nr:hypothetical protein [Bacteroidia bacterium]
MKRTVTRFFLASLLAGASLVSKAQAVIYHETFDADSSALPAGWSSSGAWHPETSNTSNGYPGASGNVNITIRNDSATGTYDLVSKSVSTTGFSSVYVSWGARLTTNFPSGGSSIQSLSWSTDGGLTWTPVAYTENSNNSNWSLDNGGMPVVLPSGAGNQSSLKIKFTAAIVNDSQGTYRIDDFTVGDASSIGIREFPSSVFASATAVPNPSSSGPVHLSVNSSENCTAVVRVCDILGRGTGSGMTVVLANGVNDILLDETLFPSAGIYFVWISSGRNTAYARVTRN